MPPEVQEYAAAELAAVDTGEIAVSAALAAVKEAAQKAANQRGQAKALDTALKALQKAAFAMEKAFVLHVTTISQDTGDVISRKFNRCAAWTLT